MKCFKESCIKLKYCKDCNFGLPCPHENMHTALHIFHTSNLFPIYCNPGHLWLDSTYLKKKEELQQEYKFFIENVQLDFDEKFIDADILTSHVNSDNNFVSKLSA